jgi:phosphoesterase RecJ-like protein
MNKNTGDAALSVPPVKTGISLRELSARIIEFDNILIICHINPDPDTVGSALGLKYIFEKLNKTAYAVCDYRVNERISGYFDISREIDSDAVKNTGFTPAHVICVDAASLGQLGTYGDIYQDSIDIVIDHHCTNTFYGAETYLDDKAAATGEIIFELAEELGIETDQDFARNIYCAIVDDTGSFRYSSTTPKTLNIAAELISAGFDFAKLNRLIFQNKTTAQIAAERLAYNSLRFCLNGKAAFMTITRETKKAAGLDGLEIDGISSMPVSIEGVEVGITITEPDPGRYKISLRSNDYINVARIAAHFGGGGHIRAAGCRYEGDIETLERELTELVGDAVLGVPEK